jgi:hypothetical protein
VKIAIIVYIENDRYLVVSLTRTITGELHHFEKLRLPLMFYILRLMRPDYAGGISLMLLAKTIL